MTQKCIIRNYKLRRFVELERIVPSIPFLNKFNEEPTFDDINLIREEKQEEIENICEKTEEDTPLDDSNNSPENSVSQDVSGENKPEVDTEPSLFICFKKLKQKEKLLRVNIRICNLLSSLCL